MSRRVDIKSPLRDKPCLASATTTFGRVQFVYDTSGFLDQLVFYGEDTVSAFFTLDFTWDVSGYCRDIIRTDNPPP